MSQKDRREILNALQGVSSLTSVALFSLIKFSSDIPKGQFDNAYLISGLIIFAYSLYQSSQIQS